MRTSATSGVKYGAAGNPPRMRTAVAEGVKYAMVRAGPQRVDMVPKPHRLDTELGPPSWQRESTTTVPPLATVRSSNCSSVWYTLLSVSTQHESRHEPCRLPLLRKQWTSVVVSRVRGLHWCREVP